MNQDKIGPEKILQVYDSKTGMRGILVIDNTARGPGKGGVRMVKDVSVQEVAKLARAMTYKTALAELPFGGAKGGIIADSKEINGGKKEKIVRSYARSLKEIIPEKYVSAPDMYMGKKEMDWFADELNSKKACTGKSEEAGGIPHELGSTGYGVVESIKVAAEHTRLNLENSKAAIEGFGEVGRAAAKFLSDLKARIVAVSDSKGVIYNSEGLDIEKLKQAKESKGSVIKYENGEVLDNSELFELNIDILVPGARPNVITEKNYDKVKAKIIAEAANIPICKEIEKKLWEKGKIIIPDIICNAGGVISSYVEYKEGKKEEVFPMISEKIKRNTKFVLEKSDREKIDYREAALKIANKRLRKE